MGEEFSC